MKTRPVFRASCPKCGKDFSCKAGTVNSHFMGEHHLCRWLPECPFCGNYLDNKLYNFDGSLTQALR